MSKNEQVGKCGSCASTTCDAKEKLEGESSAEYAERLALSRSMCSIKKKILVLSGKGGVGKSTVAANLAVALSRTGKRVGLLDVDIHGPSVPTMFGLADINAVPGSTDTSIAPVEISENLKAMSIGFLLEDKNDALIWRGPMKIGVVKQFLKDVEWGELDYLIADLPPGTGDEPLSMCQMINDISGAVVVSTPQEVALVDVRKSINFCSKLGLRVLGVVENMSGFKCPKCGEVVNVFKSGGAERMCAEMGVPFAGRIPLMPGIVEAADDGKLAEGLDAEASEIFRGIIENLLDS
ncbi:MAG: Mrp/NBP35 family ATP-binding protein [Victivallales bacterium]|nr:Mrp/NBP35 family ATP-binding protein [Victivallales bacterium]